MITDEQFKSYIDQLSDSYEKIKDYVYASSLNVTGPSAQNILGELSNFRDVACTALRDSHINKNFHNN